MNNRNETLFQADTSEEGGPKWLGVPCRVFEGPFNSLRERVPFFDRQPLFVSSGSYRHVLSNPLYDTIVRMPTPDSDAVVPVGVVSKHYRLVQHRDVLEHAACALQRAGIAISRIKFEIKLTRFGERMLASFELPDDYDFTPGDENPLKLRFECMNSVDGSTPLSAMMTWMRQVCGNGLMMRIRQVDVRERHDRLLDLDGLGAVLEQGLALAEHEKKQYEEWQKIDFGDTPMRAWINGPLRERWGAKAAARTYLILTRGRDGDYADPFEQAPPTGKTMVTTKAVPGMFPPASDLFAVSQALSWIAKEQRNLQDQISRMKQIPAMLGFLRRLAHREKTAGRVSRN